MISEATVATVALSEDAGVDPRLLALLVLHFGTPELVLEQLPDRLTELPQVPNPRALAIVGAAERLDDVRSRLKALAERGIRPISIFDAEYPESLRIIPDPPSCLYLRGAMPASDRLLSVVGSGFASAEGIALAVDTGKELARLDTAVVSGLTGGISGGVHLGCLTAAGQCFAVVGFGLDKVYAPEEEVLAAQIEATGGILSECPPEAAVSRARELARDRIILALSPALVVIEPESEAAHMAAMTDEMLRLGKPVFVLVREPSDSSSELLRLGAYPLPSPEGLEAALQFV